MLFYLCGLPDIIPGCTAVSGHSGLPDCGLLDSLTDFQFFRLSVLVLLFVYFLFVMCGRLSWYSRTFLIVCWSIASHRSFAADARNGLSRLLSTLNFWLTADDVTCGTWLTGASIPNNQGAIPFPIPPFFSLTHSPSPIPSLPSPPFPSCRKAAPWNQLEGWGAL